MEKNNQALASSRCGDERGAVGEPRPGPVIEAGRRLGEDLPRHGHLLRRGEAEKRAALSERSDVFGGLPRQRAAELTAAPPQVSREKVVIAGGEAGAGKAQQHAALVEKLHNRLMLRSRRDAHIRERENRRLFAQQGNNGIARRIRAIR